jgi:hypothetical protein
LYLILGPKPMNWVIIGTTVFVLLLDQILRSRSGSSEIIAEQCIPIPKFGFELVVRTQLACEDLSYVRLRFPGITGGIYHPFTVYSVTPNLDSNDRNLRFLIQSESEDYRKLGWCRKLGRWSRKNNTIGIEGPFRSGLSRVMHGGVDGVVLVAMGSGVTTVLAVLNYLNRNRPDIPTVVVFSSRERGMVTFAKTRVHMFKPVAPPNPDDNLLMDDASFGSMTHLDSVLFFTGRADSLTNSADWTEVHFSRINETVIASLLLKYGEKWATLKPPAEPPAQGPADVRKKSLNRSLDFTDVEFGDILTSNSPDTKGRIDDGVDNTSSQPNLNRKREALMEVMYPDEGELDHEPCCCDCFAGQRDEDRPRPRQAAPRKKSYHVFYCGNQPGKEITESATNSLAAFSSYTFKFHREYF